ncbi:fatty acid desaturase family protein [Eisenibacter elegans]|uniref:fatty acid desaturase family protein n=1 Tax=Eisenibacter elegans TaxID=997 RepID=UPI00040B538E|nr:acyl-CoA desaturase [Eisenibacter elegans]
MSTTLKFGRTAKTNSEQQFHPLVKKRVQAYFNDNNLSKHANAAMVFKTFFFMGGAVLLYSLILWGGFGLWAMLGLAALLGMFQAFIGFNISHDGMHGAYSPKNWVNRLVGSSFYLIGANVEVWKVTHNNVHHMYTNIAGHDEDIEIAPGLIRLSHHDQLKPVMRYQHIYAFFLYCFASLTWVFRKDYVKFFKEKIGQYDNRRNSWQPAFNLFFFKAVYYVLFIGLPLWLLPITWWQFIIGFLVMHFAEGVVLGLVFQLAHVVEGTDFPLPNDDGNMEALWAVHQMHTTANFARKSYLANFLCGGLNFQIEHHLFPKICHIHYRAISDIVKQTAEECGVPYIENKTFWGALVSHQRCLKSFGRDALMARRVGYMAAPAQ